MKSEDRKLLPGDISRKSKKLEKTLGQLEGLNEGTRKYHRKMFKAEKTLDQLQTGKSGIRPNKSAFNMSGFKLPHLAPFNNNEQSPKHKVEKPKIKRQKTLEEQRAEALKFKKLTNPPKLLPMKEPKLVQSNSGAVAKQTVSSSGGNDLDEFLKRVESRKITNPEYADQEGPKRSKSYDFFITNRSPESDRVARQMDSLNKAVMEQAKNRRFDEMKKTRAYQQDLMSKYNID